FAQIASVVRDAVFLGDRRSGVLIAPDQRGDFNALDALERIKMLLAKGALAGNTDFHGDLLAADTLDFLTRGGAFQLGRSLFANRLLCALDTVRKDDVTDRDVRRRHGVEAIDLVDLVVERA